MHPWSSGASPQPPHGRVGIIWPRAARGQMAHLFAAQGMRLELLLYPPDGLRFGRAKTTRIRYLAIRFKLFVRVRISHGHPRPCHPGQSVRCAVIVPFVGISIRVRARRSMKPPHLEWETA